MTQRFTVVSTMKNEGPFILDWVAHYRALGFDDMVVCSNDCEDSTADLLDALQARGILRHHRTRIWPRAGIHRSALKQARRYEEVRRADWVFVCDVDEYLNIHVGDGSVRALVEAAGPAADIISVPWRVFGPSGVRAFFDVPVTRQFTHAEAPPEARPEAGKFAKSLFTGQERFRRMGLHAPIPHEEEAARILGVHPCGTPWLAGGEKTGARPSFAVAQVNHYALRAADTFLVKRARGRANHMSHVLGLDYWERFDLNHEIDTSISRYEPATRALRDALLADPELRALHDAAVDWYGRKIRELRADPGIAALASAITATLRPLPEGVATPDRRDDALQPGHLEHQFGPAAGRARGKAAA